MWDSFNPAKATEKKNPVQANENFSFLSLAILRQRVNNMHGSKLPK